MPNTSGKDSTPMDRLEADPSLPVPAPGAHSEQPSALCPAYLCHDAPPDLITQEWVSEAHHWVREHPLGTVAAAVVIGPVFVRIMR